MKKLIYFLLLIFNCTFACSPYFSSNFCSEITYLNQKPVKYKKIEIEPNWIMFLDGYHSFNLIVRF